MSSEVEGTMNELALPAVKKDFPLTSLTYRGRDEVRAHQWKVLSGRSETCRAASCKPTNDYGASCGLCGLVFWCSSVGVFS